MLEVEYELRRQEGSGYERTFYTDDMLKKIEGNAVYIKAPNASGKSTFLNILALSLFGDQLNKSDSRISKSLQEDIQYIISRKNQTCTFKVRFLSKNGKIELVSTKTDPISNDITVTEIIDGGKPRYLPFQTFVNEYFLVYDIPEDPLNRISEILSEVKNQQMWYLKKVSEFIRFLGEISSDIGRSRDEAEIKKTKDSISTYIIKEVNLKNSIDNIEGKLKIIRCFLAIREFERYLELAFSLQQSIDIMENSKKKNEKTVKRFGTQYENKREFLTKKVKIVNNYLSELAYKIENLFIETNEEQIKYHLTILRNFKLIDSLETFKLDTTIFSELEYLKSQISNYLENKKIKESGKKGSFYQELIQILEQYKSMEILLPGLEKSIDEYIELLQLEYDKNKEFKAVFDELKECLKKIEDTEKELNNFPKELESLKLLYSKREEKSQLVITDEKIDSDIDDLQNKLGSTLGKVDYYKDLAEKNGIQLDNTDIDLKELKEQIFRENKDFAHIFHLTEKSYLKEISKINEELESLKRSYSDNESILRQNRDKLFDLENREPHKYQDYGLQIDHLDKVLSALTKNLSNYNDLINKISEGQPLHSKTELQYNEEISYYFAKKISEFPYIDEFIKPIKIDFVSKLIVLENGREIDMKDISTGQSMSMYIQAVLKRPKDDKRKMIVIFDEGATMDSKSLEPIKRILEKQIEENKVLFAIFAKAVDEELTITNLV